MISFEHAGMQFADSVGESSVDGSMADLPRPTGVPMNVPSASMLSTAHQFVVNSLCQYPLVCVGLAVATGAMLGCLVKRR